jgi:hypothetical protein
MTRLTRLATAAALAVLSVPASAQQRASALARDSAAKAGWRDGRAAARSGDVAGYALAGAATGFAAGSAGLPLLIFGDAPRRVAGAAIFIPVVWTAAAARRSYPAPPPGIAQAIQHQPAEYQEAFRAAYAERLAQRRRRTAAVAGVTGGVVGAATLVALVVYAVRQSDW